MENLSLDDCLRLLSDRTDTHPHLTAIWTNYLTQGSPTQQDFQDCQLAVSNMDTIDDIDPTQLPAIFVIFSFLTSQQDVVIT